MPSLEPLVGEWDGEDGFALLVKRDGQEIVINNSPNDDVRFEISDVSSGDSSVSFTQHHFLQDGTPNLFSEVACKCTIEVVKEKPDSLRFTIRSPDLPEGESEIYTRRK